MRGKPWDNEPSLEADKSWVYSSSFDADTKVVTHEKFADLERRLRHAELLLEDSLKYRAIGYGIGHEHEVKAHLEAARQKDGR